MKKTNNKSIEATEVKVRRQKKMTTFFLYVEGRGFIHLDEEVGAMPNFSKGELLSFTSKSSANYAREFFINIKLAEKIDIFAKVA